MVQLPSMCPVAGATLPQVTALWQSVQAMVLPYWAALPVCSVWVVSVVGLTLWHMVHALVPASYQP